MRKAARALKEGLECGIGPSKEAGEERKRGDLTVGMVLGGDVGKELGRVVGKAVGRLVGVWGTGKEGWVKGRRSA